jgi:hypothetical protein
MQRLIALGASNLTRGFQTVVDAARRTSGPDVEIVAALGHGRSYGTTSWFLGRTLPGILQCELWPHLTTMPPAPARALVTDIGNDILYGFPAEQIVAWIDEAVCRLRSFTADVRVADLPMTSIRRLSNAKFLVFRTILAPQCRLPLEQVRLTAEQVSAGLQALASRRNLRVVSPDPLWFGVDPVHIRPRAWRTAWNELMGPGVVPSAGGPGAFTEWLRLYRMRARRQTLFGVEQVTPQPGVRLAAGGRVWLF